jgi:hypothetical protein
VDQYEHVFIQMIFVIRALPAAHLIATKATLFIGKDIQLRGAM